MPLLLLVPTELLVLLELDALSPIEVLSEVINFSTAPENGVSINVLSVRPASSDGVPQ